MSNMVKSLALGAVVVLGFAGSSMAGSLQVQSGFAESAIIIVSGKGAETKLNPQPLPPKEKLVGIVGAGGEACLNPQPLPPKEKSIIIVGGKGGATCLNPQPLPPKEAFR